MSSSVACDNGTRAAPKTPWKHTEHDDLAQRLGRAAQHRGEREAQDAADIEGLAAIAGRQPADRRGHDRRRGDVGGQHPGDFVVARGEAALHVGQRHVGDGLVEQLQHRGADRARGDHRPMGRIVVDGFSRHVGGLVVVRCARRQDADKRQPASNATGARPGIRVRGSGASKVPHGDHGEPPRLRCASRGAPFPFSVALRGFEPR